MYGIGAQDVHDHQILGTELSRRTSHLLVLELLHEGIADLFALQAHDGEDVLAQILFGGECDDFSVVINAFCFFHSALSLSILFICLVEIGVSLPTLTQVLIDHIPEELGDAHPLLVGDFFDCLVHLWGRENGNALGKSSGLHALPPIVIDFLGLYYLFPLSEETSHSENLDPKC